MSRTPFLFAAFALAAPLASAPEPVKAQESVFVDLGRWTIYQHADGRTCDLRLAPSNGVTLSYRKTGTSRAVLTLLTSRMRNFGGEIVFAFDDAEFSGRSSGRGSYTPNNNGQSIEEAFRGARILTLRQGDASIFSVSLQTSSAAFRLLKQCAENGRLGSSIATLAQKDVNRQSGVPTSASRQPRGSTLPPPARSEATRQTSLQSDPEPRNADNWLRSGDIRSSRIDTPGWSGGVLHFTLVVNRRGRAEECVVNQSSGSRDFDGEACRALMRRARFDPATNSEGQEVAGRYSSSIRYAPSRP